MNNLCTCTLCDSGYYLTGVTCTPCTTVKCSVCPSNVCNACIQGYYFSGGNCNSVNTAANCIQAKTGSATLCSICRLGYFLGSDFNCYMCQQNCLACSSRFTCTNCLDYTKLIDGLCINYPSNCA